jgi:hypothetical protein
MVLRVVKEEYDAPEDGEYIAELTAVEPMTSDKHPEFGTSLRFTFKVLEEPCVGTLVSGLVSAVWRPGNKLDKWLLGLSMETANIGDELDLEALKGRQARVYVEKDPKSSYVNVKLVKPLRATDTQRVVSAPKVIVTKPELSTPVTQVVKSTESTEAPQQASELPITPKKRNVPF